jgi:hypothetical protein
VQTALGFPSVTSGKTLATFFWGLKSPEIRENRFASAMSLKYDYG